MLLVAFENTRMSTEPAGKKISTTLTVTNRAAPSAANRGSLSPDQVRSVMRDNVLVDTGATTLCLPAEAIAQLGLELWKEVEVATATGASTARIFQAARISLLGREGTFACLKLPRGRDSLLGVVPLEMLGLELDLKNQRLQVLPDDTRDPYLTIMQQAMR